MSNIVKSGDPKDTTETGDKIEEIYAWLGHISFSRPKRNIARDFSDAVLMAELLKKYYPQYVDVHNYIADNSIAKKIDNWATLNRKVLTKVNVKLNKEMINRLASSQPGAIERFLTDLRSKILKDCSAERDSFCCDCEVNDRGEMVTPLLNPPEIANKMVPRHIFNKLKQELRQRKDAITVLNHKISYLESLIKLKDQRLSDLTLQLTTSECATSARSQISNAALTEKRMNKI